MEYLNRVVLKLSIAALSACTTSVVLAQSAAGAPPVRIAMVESFSGPFANTGESVFRNLVWATERVNARGGVKLPSGNRPLAIVRYDSKGQNEEALSALRAAIDDGAQFVVQGNSSATAAALLDAINKNNERDPARRDLITLPA